MHSKLQRWTDLIAALLARKYPVTFDQLAREVPAYADGLDPARKETVKRAFERDKDELKAFGIAIEVITVDEGESTGYRYRLNPERFYLPYLTLSRESERPEKPAGYRALTEMEFEPGEIETLVLALKRVDALGDPMLRDHAAAALGKIGFDLSALPAPDVDVTVLADDRVKPATFDALAQALRRRKAVTFNYRSPASDVVSSRRVRPYGLFFIHAHWYLAGFDEGRDAVRNFRLTRMTTVRVNRAHPHATDFDVPAHFHLQEHARSRAAWDLGDGTPMIAEVRFTGAGSSGAARAAASGGDVVDGRPDVRRFPVRRLATFARWLLSLGGEAVPLSPPQLVTAWRALARDTLQVYERR